MLNHVDFHPGHAHCGCGMLWSMVLALRLQRRVHGRLANALQLSFSMYQQAQYAPATFELR
jgi:hypothetical protein